NLEESRVTRIFQDSAFSKFAPGRGRREWPPQTWGRQRWGGASAPVISLLRPCHCQFFSRRRLDFVLPSPAQVRHLGSKPRVRSTPAAARDPMAVRGQRTGRCNEGRGPCAIAFDGAWLHGPCSAPWPWHKRRRRRHIPTGPFAWWSHSRPAGQRTPLPAKSRRSWERRSASPSSSTTSRGGEDTTHSTPSRRRIRPLT